MVYILVGLIILACVYAAYAPTRGKATATVLTKNASYNVSAYCDEDEVNEETLPYAYLLKKN